MRLYNTTATKRKVLRILFIHFHLRYCLLFKFTQQNTIYPIQVSFIILKVILPPPFMFMPVTVSNRTENECQCHLRLLTLFTYQM